MGGGIPVYIIDDDEGMLRSTQFLLESYDIQSERYSDPFAFLHQLGSLERGCVLTDLRMPTMSGLELHDAVRARGIDWPVILMSAHLDVQDSEVLGRDIVEMVEKPFTGARLMKALGRAFGLLKGMDGGGGSPPSPAAD